MNADAGERGIRNAYALALLLFSAGVLHLALTIRIDYYDSYNYLLQAKRLTDPAYAFVSFDGIRPRALVGMLAAFDLVTRWLFGFLPSFTAYHAVMSLISICYVTVWVSVGKRLAGAKAGYLLGMMLVCCQLTLHYAPTLLADLTSGLLWGLTSLAFLHFAAFPRSRRSALVLGVAGAVAGISKHYTLPLLPTLLFFFNVVGRRREISRGSLTSLIAYGLSVEILLKISSDGQSGWHQQLGQIFSGIEGLLQFNARGARQEPWLYADGLLRMWGLFFWPIALVSLFKGRKFAAKPQASTLAIALTTALFLFVIQFLFWRELRYLLPFLPMALLPIAWSAVQALERATSKRARIVWGLAWGLALLPGAARSFLDYRAYHVESVYRMEAEMGRLFAFLKDSQCREISACWHSLRPKSPFEFPRDAFYRQYDLGPNFSYHVQKPTLLSLCSPKSPSEIRHRDFERSLSPEVCYLISTKGPSKPTHLTALRPKDGRWEGEVFLVD